ncbi:MAG: AAA family ATPase [Candidatus Saccharimonadales bacterium]
MRLIGIAGTDGSGKDSLGDMLVKGHGWLFVSVTDILRSELQKQNIPLKRENLRALSMQLRREQGLGVLINKAVKKFEKLNQREQFKGLAIASLRNPGEADMVHELGGQVVWLDADPKVRYLRIAQRQRGTEDQVSFKEFLAEEKIQMQASDDETALDLAAVKAKADIFIENSGDNLEAFIKKAEKALQPYL